MGEAESTVVNLWDIWEKGKWAIWNMSGEKGFGIGGKLEGKRVVRTKEGAVEWMQLGHLSC